MLTKKWFNKLLKKDTAVVKGKHAEDLACAFLKKQGLQLITQNFRSRYGEIDLIMLDQDTIVFIEVRFRKNSDYGQASETVGYNKQQRIIVTAMQYLEKNQQHDTACRFDVLSIGITAQEPQIDWIKDAFQQ